MKKYILPIAIALFMFTGAVTLATHYKGCACSPCNCSPCNCAK